MALPNAQPSASGGPSHSNLGQILVDLGIITPQQLSQALATGPEKDLAKILVELAFTTEEKIMKGIGVKAMVPYFTSLEGLYSGDSANIISEELARRLQVVPLFKIDNVVTVAMVNPTDYFTIDTLTRTLGMKIDPVVCMRSTIFETINKLYGGLDANDPKNAVNMHPPMPTIQRAAPPGIPGSLPSSPQHPTNPPGMPPGMTPEAAAKGRAPT